MTEKLTTLERELRRAVESHRFAETQRLILSFCQAVEAHVRTLPPGDPRIQEIAVMTGDVLGWTRTMVQSARESVVLQLRQIPKVQRYLQTPAPAGLPLDV